MNRKAFNFYKSYFDVAVELPEEDRNEFVWSIVVAQFTGELIEPKSKLARLMFLGQKHSILKQLEGFKAATKPPTEAPTEGPYQQVQEKGQVQEKEEEQGPNQKVIGTGEKYFLVVPKTIGSIKYRIQGIDGLKQYMEIHQSILDHPDQHQRFMREVNGDVFNDLMHVRNRFKKFIEKQYA